MIAGAGAAAAVVDWSSAAVATVAVPALTDGVVVARLGDTAACIAVDCAAVGGDAVGCTVVGCVVVGGAAVGCAAVDDDDDVSTAIVAVAVVTFDVVAGAQLDVNGAEDTTAIGASVAAAPAAAGADDDDDDDDDFPLALMPVVSLLSLTGTLLMGTLRVWLSLLEIMVETLLLLLVGSLLLLLLLLVVVVVVVVAEVVVVPMAEAGLVALLLLPDPVPMPILLAPLDALLSPGRLPLLLLVLLVVVLVVLLVLMLLAVVTPPELGNVVTAVTPATVLLGELTAGNTCTERPPPTTGADVDVGKYSLAASLFLAATFLICCMGRVANVPLIFPMFTRLAVDARLLLVFAELGWPMAAGLLSACRAVVVTDCSVSTCPCVVAVVVGVTAASVLVESGCDLLPTAQEADLISAVVSGGVAREASASTLGLPPKGWLSPEEAEAAIVLR